MLNQITTSKAEQVASRILKSIMSTRIPISPGPNLSITMSGGLVMFRDGELLSETIQRADHRLYQAKRTGKARIQFC